MIDFILQLIRRDVTRGVAGTILLKVGSGGLAFAMFSLAAHAMSPHAFGDFATWLSVAQIASVVGLVGQELLLVRFLNEYQVNEQPGLIKGLLRSSLTVSSVTMLIAISVVTMLASIRGESWLFVLALCVFTAVNAGLMLGSQIARSLVSILMGEGNREFFWRVAVVMVLLAVLFGHGRLAPFELFGLMTIAMALGLLVQIVSIARALPNLRNVPTAAETSRWRSSALRFWLASILEAANQYFDVILVYWMLDPATAGIYFAASRLANIFAMLSAALYTFAARRLPSLYFSKNHQEFERTLQLMAEVTALCVVSGLPFIWFGAPHLLGLFGPHFANQQWVLIVLAIGTAFQAAGGPAAAILQLTGHEGKYVPVVAANVVLRLLGFVVLIPWFGVLGAAISATASLALATVALNVLCRRLTRVDPSILVLTHLAASKLRLIRSTWPMGTTKRICSAQVDAKRSFESR
jgi:O-antigen/teichoic acid export membrane protein